MNPGLDTEYLGLEVNRDRCKETVAAGKLQSIISMQSAQQKELLRNHDTSTPVYIEGPNLVYIKVSIFHVFRRFRPRLLKTNHFQMFS